MAPLFGLTFAFLYTILQAEINNRGSSGDDRRTPDQGDRADPTFFNTNFWRIREGKFQEVYVYFSDENVLV